jgi:hypothetical protein
MVGGFMLESFRYETFSERLGETFRLHFDDEHVFDFVLATAGTLSDRPWDYPGRVSDRTPFMLTFVGPPEYLFPQRIYRMEHDAIGAFDLFIVPVGRDANGVQYEAIFT